MNERRLLQEMAQDLQLAPRQRVIYLEGKTDVAIFFALVGVEVPRDGRSHEGVLVRGLRDGLGSGETAVSQRTTVARNQGYAGIYGVVDGDGRPLRELTAEFDAPHGGPRFTWKAYCIENLLVKTGWPAGWGREPDWEGALLEHAPYVGLNRLYRDIRDRLEELGLARFSRPTLDKPLKTADEVMKALEQGRELIHGYDVATRFTDELRSFEAAVRVSVDAGHALVDGKWLVDVFAPRRTQRTPQACRDEWIAHAISVGGLPEVRMLWRRLTGE